MSDSTAVHVRYGETIDESDPYFTTLEDDVVRDVENCAFIVAAVSSDQTGVTVYLEQPPSEDDIAAVRAAVETTLEDYGILVSST